MTDVTPAITPPISHPIPEAERAAAAHTTRLLAPMLNLLSPGFFTYSPNLKALAAYYLLGSGNYDFQKSSRAQMARMAKHHVHTLRGLHHVIEIINAIDDTVDAMHPRDLLALGEAKLGSEPCEFLLNKEVFPQTYIDQSMPFVDMGLITREEGIGFCNLAACLVREEAEAALAFASNPSPENRERVAETHMRLTDALSGVILFVFHRTPQVAEAAARGQLGLDALNEAYPEAIRAGRALQLRDEFIDLVDDIREEIATGRPSPNFLLAALHRNGQLLDENGKILPYLQDFVNAAQPATTIKLRDLPEPVRNVVRDALDAYRECIAPLPEPVHSLLQATWNKTLESGVMLRDEKGRHPPLNILGKGTGGRLEI